MNTQQPNNQLLAVCATSLPDKHGNCQPHLYGAIFDVGSDGIARDFTPIDFEGRVIREWRYNNFGKSEKLDVRHAPAEKFILLPITSESAELIKAAMDVLKEEIRAGRNPFYPGYSGARPHPQHERLGRAPVSFTGAKINVPTQEMLDYERNCYDRPRAATNCRQFLFDVLQHIGGVPIQDLLAVDGHMPKSSNAVAQRMHQLGDEAGVPWNKREGGKLIVCDNDRLAYVFDQPTGWITAELNRRNHRMANGEAIPIAKLLMEQSKPFYSPQLNGHNLGQGLSCGASFHGR